MYRRNLLLLTLVIPTCLLAWAARDRSGQGPRFAEIARIVGQRYIEPVEREHLFEAAMNGLFASLDENSAYVPTEAHQDLTGRLEQRFAGIGVELSVSESSHDVVILSPVYGGPAWQAGVVPGDRILAINGQRVQGKTVADVAARLRGEEGSRLRLLVAAPPGVQTSEFSERELELTRRLVRLESVRGDRRLSDGRWDWRLEGEPGLAYLRITQFGEQTEEEVAAVLDDLTATRPPRGVILDLRGNAGGLLESAVAVCDLFLDDGIIVTTLDHRREAAADQRRATPGARLADVPVVVLIDSFTASAAEIVAACLQDHKRAVLVGSQSYGKGTVQTLLPLAFGHGAIRLTTAEYRRPSGAAIERPAGIEGKQAWGVCPDPGFAFTPTGLQLDRWRRWRRRRDWPQLPQLAGADNTKADTVADPAATLPRHADPVLARSLMVFSEPTMPGRHP
jgi:carboxyl-terminal processing protease